MYSTPSLDLGQSGTLLSPHFSTTRSFGFCPCPSMFSFSSSSPSLCSVAKAIFYVTSAPDIPSPATHVPAFYCPPTQSSDSLLVLTIIPVFGSVCGGLHCLGWNLIFPTGAERLIWRIASLTITLILPLLVMLLAIRSYSCRIYACSAAYLRQPQVYLLSLGFCRLLFTCWHGLLSL